MLGDALITTPALRTLKTVWPQAHLTYLTEHYVEATLLHNPDIDEFLFYGGNILKSIATQPQYDVALDFTGGANSQYLCALSGASQRLGHSHAAGKMMGKIDTYNVEVGLRVEATDAVDAFLKFTRNLGLSDATRETKIYLTNQERNFADAFWQEHSLEKFGQVIGFHPGGDHAIKLWPAARYAKLADNLVEKSGCRVLIFQGPKEAHTAEAMRAQMKQPALLVPLLKLREYAGLVQKCSLLITNDGGALHIGAAVQTKLLGIFVNRPLPKFWFPYQERSGAMQLIADQNHQVSVSEAFRAACRLLEI